MGIFNNKSIPPEIDPDEILLDSSNIPAFELERLEGRLERALSRRSLFILSAILILGTIIYLGRLGYLQIIKGEAYNERSEANHLRHRVVYADRGSILDRNGVPIAWTDQDGQRQYISETGFGHIIGYLGLPTESDIGYYLDEKIGKAGVEMAFDEKLRGQHGLKIEEVDVKGGIVSAGVQRQSIPGDDIYLTIDSKIQTIFSKYIAELIEERGFRGGVGLIMDVRNGDLIAMVSLPEYDPAIMSSSTAKTKIEGYTKDSRQPFLNRAIDGLFTPGSIVKTFLAAAALEEGIVSPNKSFESTGSLVIPNPYNPDQPTIFTDWKAHGFVDMRRALAVSSNVYFYIIGGGFEGQKGLQIARIVEYSKKFMLDSPTRILGDDEPNGVIPSPEWKEEYFPGDPWRIGDTYLTSIGQYGFQTTPLQVLRGISAFATGGVIREPKLFHNIPVIEKDLQIDGSTIKVIQEGMRMAVLEGTAAPLNIPQVELAAKTGTAELDAKKLYVNSWVSGYFPYDNPKYSFLVLMERGPRTNTVGASAAMRRFLEWAAIYAPEFLE